MNELDKLTLIRSVEIVNQKDHWVMFNQKLHKLYLQKETHQCNIPYRLI